MKTVNECLRGLIWSVQQLQQLIPDGPSWDSKAQSISDHLHAAKTVADAMSNEKFPYICEYKNGNSFYPTMIDFENKMVFHAYGQNGSGAWVDFSDVEILKNPFFSKSL